MRYSTNNTDDVYDKFYKLITEDVTKIMRKYYDTHPDNNIEKPLDRIIFASVEDNGTTKDFSPDDFSKLDDKHKMKNNSKEEIAKWYFKDVKKGKWRDTVKLKAGIDYDPEKNDELTDIGIAKLNDHINLFGKDGMRVIFLNPKSKINTTQIVDGNGRTIRYNVDEEELSKYLPDPWMVQKFKSTSNRFKPVIAQRIKKMGKVPLWAYKKVFGNR